jgi:hypothetical protein
LGKAKIVGENSYDEVEIIWTCLSWIPRPQWFKVHETGKREDERELAL